MDLASLAWPALRLGEALEGLSRAAKLEPRRTTPPALPFETASEPRAFARWMTAAGHWIGVNVEALSAPYPDVERAIEQSAPCVWKLPPKPEDGGLSRFVVVLSVRRHQLELIAPDESRPIIPVTALRDALCSSHLAQVRPLVAHVLATAGLSAAAHAASERRLLERMTADREIEGGFMLRLAPHLSLLSHMRRAGLFSKLASIVACHFLLYGTQLLAWAAIGAAALEGHYDPAWLWAWALLVLMSVPLGMFSGWLSSLFGIGLSTLIKQRLLSGVLALAPEEVRAHGSGQILSRVIESEAIEGLLTSGAFGTALALVELLLLPALLSRGVLGAAHIALLSVFVALLVLASWQLAQRRSSWSEQRIELTRDLVERMHGHRTRLAQQAPERFHDGEDEQVERYLELSRAQDHSQVMLSSLASRGFVVVSMLCLVPSLLAGPIDVASLAFTLGGTLLAQQSLAKLASGLLNLADARIAWRMAGPLFRAASEPPAVGMPGIDARGAGEQPVLACREVSYGHVGRPERILQRCTLEVKHGDRVLLEGPSGGGKSTLASLLSGLRLPSSGLVLLHGLDRHALGSDRFRNHVALAPQFHENHVLTGSLAFNLLMGREWPATPELMAEARAVLEELGLADLVSRMPSGLEQMVGESGWQLSHGERSRLFVARALLQGAEVVILDESFGALDPENLARSLSCVMARAPTLLVIAHP